jgi:hypothetical protein
MPRQLERYRRAFGFLAFAGSVLLIFAPNAAHIIRPAKAATIENQDDERTCTLRSIRGSYAVVGHGTIVSQLPGLPPPPVLFAETGLATFDGVGNLFGRVSASLNGVIIEPTFAGTYSVNADCSTSFTVNTSVGLVVHEDGVIIGQGKEFNVQSTDPGWVRTLVGKKL